MDPNNLKLRDVLPGLLVVAAFFFWMYLWEMYSSRLGLLLVVGVTVLTLVLVIAMPRATAQDIQSRMSKEGFGLIGMLVGFAGLAFALLSWIDRG